MSVEQERTEYYNYLLWIEWVEFEKELMEIVSKISKSVNISFNKNSVYKFKTVTNDGFLYA